ncbi:D-glycerate dehydrogenase [candidate division WOR-3 bacterium]|nr:D-glycerate dehydrogenase [candidate division WOR-3 bacterium]
MAKNILVTRKIPDAGLDVLRGNSIEFEIFPKDDRPITKKELKEKVPGKDALLCLLTDKIDSDVIEFSDKLKIIANYAVGYDNIDIEKANEKKILVTNTPGVLTEATADLTFALLLSVVRRIPEADRFVRERRFKGWSPELLTGGDLNGKYLGVVGLGRIGQAVARRASGFGMKIIYFSRTKNGEFEKSFGASYADMDELAESSDVITLHAPLNGETRHIFDMKRLLSMKKTAYLINTSRGPLIDEKALCEVLKNKSIAGAALDVFEHEPDIEEELLKLDNVVLAPHIGSASKETRDKMAVMSAESIVSFLRGEIPFNAVNREAVI